VQNIVGYSGTSLTYPYHRIFDRAAAAPLLVHNICGYYGTPLTYPYHRILDRAAAAPLLVHNICGYYGTSLTYPYHRILDRAAAAPLLVHNICGYYGAPLTHQYHQIFDRAAVATLRLHNISGYYITTLPSNMPPTFLHSFHSDLFTFFPLIHICLHSFHSSSFFTFFHSSTPLLFTFFSLQPVYEKVYIFSTPTRIWKLHSLHANQQRKIISLHSIDIIRHSLQLRRETDHLTPPRNLPSTPEGNHISNRLVY
jgi:hypothetical protein